MVTKVFDLSHSTDTAHTHRYLTGKLYNLIYKICQSVPILYPFLLILIYVIPSKIHNTERTFSPPHIPINSNKQKCGIPRKRSVLRSRKVWFILSVSERVHATHTYRCPRRFCLYLCLLISTARSRHTHKSGDIEFQRAIRTQRADIFRRFLSTFLRPVRFGCERQ